MSPLDKGAAVPIISPMPLSDAEIATRLEGLPGWSYDGTDIRRTYFTDGWPVTMLLVNSLALIAESANHHPDLEVGYAKLTVRLHTHSAKGVTEKDFAVARRFEETAMWQPPPGSGLEKLAQRLVRGAE